MTVNTILFLFGCSFLVSTEAAFVDTVTKCSFKDSECLKTSFGEILKKAGPAGVPELNLPIFDPLTVENESFSILGLLNLNVTDIKARGVKDCIINEYEINLDKGVGTNTLTCDVVVEGKYKADATSPIFTSVLGSERIHGDGNGKVEINKLRLKFSFPLSVEKNDGELYVKYDYNHAKYEYEIQGDAKMYADSIYIGDKESGEMVLKFFNDNWKLIINTFGGPILQKAFKIAFTIASKLYDSVPAKYYLTDDLTSYVK